MDAPKMGELSMMMELLLQGVKDGTIDKDDPQVKMALGMALMMRSMMGGPPPHVQAMMDSHCEIEHKFNWTQFLTKLEYEIKCGTPNPAYKIWCELRDHVVRSPEHKEFRCTYREGAIYKDSDDCMKLDYNLGHMRHVDVISKFEFNDKFAWGIPTPAVLDYILNLKQPVIEIGAGRGYIANELERVGADVIAYDTKKYDADGGGHLFYDVRVGGPENIEKHPGRMLLLCWPSGGGFTEGLGFDDDCLKQYKGEHLIYIGEPINGCTGSEQFHERLAKEWKLVHAISMARFPHDYGTMFHYSKI